mmetsp:Transcript_17344/g.36363  ORF Transcript_17344/g.36363 Transcript_17344/m.36363 type:complete len:88 (-) Transcript_17344:17-280(-)
METTEMVALLNKTQIIAAIEEAYLDKLNDFDEGFLHSTPIVLLVYLFDRHGLITEAMITKNKQQIDEPFDPNQPLTTTPNTSNAVSN